MTKTNNKPMSIRIQNALSLYGTLLERAQLSSRLGKSYSDDRNLYEALGYKTNPEFSDFIAQFARNAIARAVIDRPARATWRGELIISEPGHHEKPTKFAQAWKDLNTRLMVKDALFRLDKLVGIGRWGCLLLGLDDVANIDGYRYPVAGKARKLVFLKSLSEESAMIRMWDQKATSPRFGMPELYDVTLNTPYNAGAVSAQVHFTRMIHVVDNKLESDQEGSSRLLPIFNNLQDIEKIVGGSAEMFWRGARPGYQGKIDPQFSISDEEKDGLEDEIDEFEHNLRRMLLMEGVEWESLAPQVTDPSKHVDAQMQMISAVTGIPRRVLLGAEVGELASSQDKANWLETVQERREEFAEPYVVRPVINKFIEYGILPQPEGGEYTCIWSDLWAMSDKEQAEVGRLRAEAVRAYMTAPGAVTIIPPKLFLKLCLGLDPDQLQEADEMRDEGLTKEDEDLMDRLLPPEAVPAGAQGSQNNGVE